MQNSIIKHRTVGILCVRKRSGWPCKTSARDGPIIRRVVMHSPISSCRKVRAIQHSKGTDACISTIPPWLRKKFKLPSRKHARKTRLMPLMKQKRVEFAKCHRQCPIPQWRQVLFSDGSTTQQFVAQKRHVKELQESVMTKLYCPDDETPLKSNNLGCNVTSWHYRTLLFATKHHYKWTLIH